VRRLTGTGAQGLQLLLHDVVVVVDGEGVRLGAAARRTCATAAAAQQKAGGGGGCQDGKTAGLEGVVHGVAPRGAQRIEALQCCPEPTRRYTAVSRMIRRYFRTAMCAPRGGSGAQGCPAPAS